MKVVLFTLDGDFIMAVDIPTLDEVPTVVTWGERVFLEPAVSRGVRLDEIARGAVSYVEALTLRLELPAGAGL